jgi:methyltransferase
VTRSVLLFLLLLAAVAAERLVELGISRRHARGLRARGALEVGAAHYPFMVAVHALTLAGAAVEVTHHDRPFLPWLGWPMLALVAGTMALRYWVIATLGERWTTRVLVLPDASLVTHGPFRFLRHPNYLAVALEMWALPLVHTCWLTATLFGTLDVVVLALRIRAEDAALGRR